MAHDWQYQPWDLRTVCKTCGLIQSNETAGLQCHPPTPTPTLDTLHADLWRQVGR